MYKGTTVAIATAIWCSACANANVAGTDVGALGQALVGDHFAGLSNEEAAAFDEGADAFAEVEGLDDGLGPVFNEKACGNCHRVGALGGAGTLFERRAGILQDGTFDSLTSQGGQLFGLFTVMNLTGDQKHRLPDCTLAKNGEPIPPEANVIARRRTTALFGLGLVDNTPAEAFQAIADAQPTSIRGHVNIVYDIDAQDYRMGKFGWKAQVPSLHQFAGDAYLNEMGITNPLFKVEQAPLGDPSLVEACDLVPEDDEVQEDDGEDVDAFTAFMRGLAPVEPEPQDAQAQAGDSLFTQIGCDGCHVRTITSGTGGSPAALNGVDYHPFSDFLLHDMASLGDGIGDNGDAAPTEMRTAPLWGLRLLDAKHQLLHDGRATSMADAIMRHDGQGSAAREAFGALSKDDKNAVIAFLNTL